MQFLTILKGCGVAIVIGFVWFVIFWPTWDSVQNETIQTINASYPDTSNLTGLGNAMAFSPLLYLVVLVIAAMVVLAWYFIKKRLEAM